MALPRTLRKREILHLQMKEQTKKVVFTYGTDGETLDAAPQTKQRQEPNTFSTTQQSEFSNDSLGANGEGDDFFDANQQNKAQRAWTSSLQQRCGQITI